MKRNVVRLLISICLTIGMFSVGVFAISETPIRYKTAKTGEELVNALSGSTMGQVVVELQNDVEIDQCITVRGGSSKKTITITITSPEGKNYKIIQKAADTRHITMPKYATLILENVTLDGNNTGGGIEATEKCTLTLKNGVIIQNCKSTNDYSAGGGAIYVSYDATLNLEGAIIKNNIFDGYSDEGGGGVYIYSAEFNMTSGSIEGNEANSGGGVMVSNGTFNMTGGSIRENENTEDYGGGVYISGLTGKFTMSGDSLIDKNRGAGDGGGVCVALRASFVMNGGIIRANNCSGMGGGVFVYNGSSFTMNGGMICGESNESRASLLSAASGGGVGLLNDGEWDSTFTMTGNSVIKDCVAYTGAGICTNNSVGTYTITMKDNATITNNQAIVENSVGGNGAGAGMYLTGGSTLNMYGNSSIDHNNADGFGGAVNVVSSNMSLHDNASIHHNNAKEYGGGISAYFSVVTVNDSTSIHHNEAKIGGGIDVTNCSDLTITGNPDIYENTALECGGGIMLGKTASTPDDPTAFVMTGGTIQKNKALSSTEGGGGIFVYSSDDRVVTVDISGTSRIIDNSAPNGHGGGIYCEEPYWGQMNIGAETVFDGNSASVAYIPPENVFTTYPSISFKQISIDLLVPYHPLNNYDINYNGIEPKQTVTLTYDLNEGTGADDEDYSKKTLVSGTEIIVNKAPTKEESVFVGWGDGTTIHQPGDKLIITEDTTLTAQWRDFVYKNVIFKVVNGTWADGSTDDIVVKVLLKDVAGLPSASGTGTVTVPIGMIPNTGYSVGLWDVVPTEIVSGIDDEVYTYTFMKKVSISYDPNGGTGVTGVDYTKKTFDYGTEVTVNVQPTKEGYIFKGWNDGTTTYQPGDKITLTEDKTLTAQWEAVIPNVPDKPSISVKPDVPESSNVPNQLSKPNQTTIETGDNSEFLLWLLLFTVAGITLTESVIISKKRSKKSNKI